MKCSITPKRIGEIMAQVVDGFEVQQYHTTIRSEQPAYWAIIQPITFNDVGDDILLRHGQRASRSAKSITDARIRLRVNFHQDPAFPNQATIFISGSG